MSHFLYFLLGLIQGLTEFLPVSSSGHLALTQYFLSEVQKESLLIEITAHFGSLLAIGYYYKGAFLHQLQNSAKSFQKELFTKLFTLFLSILPAGLVGLFLKDHITSLFTDVSAIAYGFLFTSLTLLLIYKFSSKSEDSKNRDWPTPVGAIFIGLSQAVALLPGVSRSGSTIAAGILAGLKPKQAAFFSFCSVAPLILAASLLSLYKVLSHAERLTQAENPLNLGVLLVSSFFFGWLGLSLVVRFLEKNKLHYFAFYLIPLSLIILIWG